MLVAQLCLTVCDPVDYSLPGSSVREFSRQEHWFELPCPPPGDEANRKTKGDLKQILCGLCIDSTVFETGKYLNYFEMTF